MKISYKFADGEHTEVGIADAIGAVIVDSRCTEEAAERRHRRHRYSYNAKSMKPFHISVRYRNAA